VFTLKAELLLKLNLTMEIPQEQYERIGDVLPVQPGNVRTSNLQVLNSVLYVLEQGFQMTRVTEAGRSLARGLHADELLV
jgi:hypothetical protein